MGWLICDFWASWVLIRNVWIYAGTAAHSWCSRYFLCFWSLYCSFATIVLCKWDFIEPLINSDFQTTSWKLNLLSNYINKLWFNDKWLSFLKEMPIFFVLVWTLPTVLFLISLLNFAYTFTALGGIWDYWSFLAGLRIIWLRCLVNCIFYTYYYIVQYFNI